MNQFTLLLSISSLVTNIHALAGKTTPGWKSRPVVPEIEAQLEGSTMASSKQPWEFRRFVQQSSQFVTLPFSSTLKKTILPGDVLWERGQVEINDFTFAPLDDVVMGGVSSSKFDAVSGQWIGRVTDANNGGFIGIRSTPAFNYDMSNCQGLSFTFQGGQGKRFKIVTRDSTDFNGVCWTTSANVGPRNSFLSQLIGPTDTTTVKVKFQSQIPTIFARTVPDQAFDPSNVVGMQMAYSKFEYDGDLNPNFALGDMELQILEIKAI
jgi:Complex I intermediate-associated protein 30 (CIA30)